MTDYFEVRTRDGAARLGELRLEDPLETPAIVDDVLVDAGSLWTDEREVPAGREDALTVLPHRGFPGGTDPAVQEALQPDYPTIDGPAAAVIGSIIAGDHGTDAYILSDLQESMGHGRAFVETITAVREAIPPDTALYAPGVATPANVPILAYAGIDLFDTNRAVIAGTREKYLLHHGEIDIADRDELPCACSACQEGIEAMDQEACVEHNVNALTAELATVREYIRQGRLREYVEGQARHEPWHTEVLRRLDQEWDYLESRTPIVRASQMQITTDDGLDRVEVKRFANRVQNRFQSRIDDRPLVLVPCSAKKPYSTSRSHRQFKQAVGSRGHLVVLTSPLGVVPTELELTYPAQHYDTVVTGQWRQSEIAAVAAILETYLEGTSYPEIIAHVPEAGYGEIIDTVTAGLDIPVTTTVDDHPTDDASLSSLRQALDGWESVSQEQRNTATVRGVADYMFGDGAGDELFPEINVYGRYPHLTVDSATGDQLAAMVPQYGTLSLTLAGAREWEESSVPVKRVNIDDFVPEGSVLAPGVMDASEAIRPGEDVVIDGPRVFGVGRARMSGPEMEASTRGIAVTVRHLEERS